MTLSLEDDRPVRRKPLRRALSPPPRARRPRPRWPPSRPKRWFSTAAAAGGRLAAAQLCRRRRGRLGADRRRPHCRVRAALWRLSARRTPHAQRRLGGAGHPSPAAQISGLEMDEEDGMLIFEGDAVLEGTEYEFEIDAYSGPTARVGARLTPMRSGSAPVRLAARGGARRIPAKRALPPRRASFPAFRSSCAALRTPFPRIPFPARRSAQNPALACAFAPVFLPAGSFPVAARPRFAQRGFLLARAKLYGSSATCSSVRNSSSRAV